MVVNVTCRHVEVTDALREHVHEKIEHAFSDFPRTESVHVILGLEKYRHLAELVVQAPGPGRVEAREESADMYASFDLAVEKAVKQMRRWHEKAQDHGKGH